MIVHQESNSLLLRLRQPELVRKVIPQWSKPIEYEGHNIAVKFDLDVVRVLRNMGVKAPSPIRYYYHWPRPPKFAKVFDHQVATAEFCTLHYRLFVLNEMGCVDADTEYLSPTGWRRIADYDGGMVAQFDKDTGAASFVRPTEYVKYPCDEMIRFKTERGVDQLLSAEHRVAYVSSTGQFMVRSAREIEAAYHATARGWSGRFITSFRGAGGAGMPDSDAQLRLQIAVIADGHFGKGTDWCVVRLKKERKKARLRELLAAAGVEYRETTPEYVGAEGFSIFRFHAPVREKEFGARWWGATPAQLGVIVDEVWRWDGCQRKAGAVEFCSTSKASADFVQYAFSAQGRTATLATTAEGRKRPLHVVHACADGKLRYLKGASSDGEKKPNVWREPSPDGFKYCFEVPQTFLVLRRNGNVFITGNTSKTASALWAADYMMSKGFVGKVLIVSPLSTLEMVWADEIFQCLMHRSYAILHGTRQKRMDLLDGQFDFYIINHDGLKIIAEELKRRKDINLIIIDEAAAYRNAKTQRFKLLEDTLQPWHRLWLLTGTPCPNSPEDAWALTRLVNPNNVPRFFGQWRRQTMIQMSQYKWVPRPESYAMAYQAMQPAVRFKKSECLDLPPVTFESRKCSTTSEQDALIREMRKEAAVDLGNGVQITAANAADKIGKLRQILCGAIKDQVTGDYHAVDHAPRLALLMECIEQAAAKVLVIVPFKGILYTLLEDIRNAWKADGTPWECDFVNGDVPPKQRADKFRWFKTTPNAKLLLCHPRVMAHGITATEADMMIFYAPIYSNEESQQVMDRINRPGQTRKMTIIRLGASSLEWNIYAHVEGKKLSQDSILEMYRRELLE